MRELEIQKALGTTKKFKAKFTITFDELTRKDALQTRREIIKILQKHFPNFELKRGSLKEIE